MTSLRYGDEELRLLTADDSFSPHSCQRYVWDLETNNLLPLVDRVHCAVLIDIDTREIMGFRPHQMGQFLELYVKAKLLIGHNSIGYDTQVILKLYGLLPLLAVHHDTMGLARAIFSDIKALDFPLAKAWKSYKAKRDAWDAEQAALVSRSLEDATELENQGGEPGDPYVALPYPYADKAPKEFPGQFVGAHSLEAWGYRIGAEKKGDYSKDMKAQGLDPWEAFNEAMFDYMLQDGIVTLGVYEYLMAQGPAAAMVELEMDTLALCSAIERNGWPFDVKAAQVLYGTLGDRRHVLEKQLAEAFPPWDVRLEDFIPKRGNKTKGYKAGVPVERWETVEFNPASREHIADRLGHKYGWAPTAFTEGGQAKVDDDILISLPFPEAALLAEYFTIAKRIGQVAEGNQAWLKQVTKDGKIHGRYNSNGAVTGRATHSNPNVGQVPSVGAPFGRDCRALWGVPAGWLQLGADQSGLELRCLASFLVVFDGGAYQEVVLHGDVHWENAKALFDLPEDLAQDPGSALHKAMRDVAKTFIYAFLYGAGDEKLGETAGISAEERAEIKSNPETIAAIRKFQYEVLSKEYMLHLKRTTDAEWDELREDIRRLTPNGLKALAAKAGIYPLTGTRLLHTYKGHLLRSRFLAKFPALRKLGTAAKKAAAKGWIKGLDGRQLPIRSPHAALNTLLQSAGALICKSWIVDAEKALLDAGLKHGWDGDFVFLGWIHDEVQLAVRPACAEQVAAIIVATGKTAGDRFPTWDCPTDVDTKLGANWAECH